MRPGPIAARLAAWVICGHFLVISSNFTDDVIEGVVNVDAGFGRGLDECATELAGEIFAFCTTTIFSYDLR